MARRSKSRNRNLEPAVMTLTFSTPQTEPGVRQQSWIDLSQVASLVNRRFYRQGLNWAVGGFKVSSLQTGAVNILKLPNTWVLANSWKKGFLTWQRMINEAISEAESIRPRFLDFKVYADADHALAGSGNNLLPVAVGIGGAGNVAIPGEWDYSTYEIPVSNVDPTLPAGNSVTRDVVVTGANYSGPGASGNFAVSLIEGYAASRALPDIEAPNMPDDASSASGSLAENWQVALFNEGTTQDSEVIQDLEEQNNIAPYPFENDGANIDTMYPGGANQLTGLEYHDFVTIYSANATDGVGIQRLKGGSFPCGLISIDWTPSATALASNLLVQIDLIPGSHRGYLAESMQEM